MARKKGETGPQGGVTQSQYAKDRGVSESMVRKWISTQRIVLGVYRDDKGRPWVIPHVADDELRKNLDPAYQMKAQTRAMLEGKAAPEPQAATTTPPPSKDDEPRGGSINELKKAHLLLKVKREKMELDKRAGELVEKRAVYRALFEFAAMLRSDLEAIPDRVTDDMLAAEDRHTAYSILSDDLHRVLNKFAEMNELKFHD